MKQCINNLARPWAGWLGVTKSLFTKSFDSYLFPNFATGSELKYLQIMGGKSSMILFKTGTERQFLIPLDLYCSASRISTITPDYDINDYGKGNMLSVRPRSYLPTFTGSGSIKPSVGSGSISGFYSREGGRVTVQIEIVWSSDSR